MDSGNCKAVNLTLSPSNILDYIIKQVAFAYLEKNVEPTLLGLKRLKKKLLSGSSQRDIFDGGKQEGP